MIAKLAGIFGFRTDLGRISVKESYLAVAKITPSYKGGRPITVRKSSFARGNK